MIDPPEVDVYSYSAQVWNPLESIMDEWESSVPSPAYIADLAQDLTDDYKEVTIRGMEVGDDRVDTSYSKERLQLELKIQAEVLMMKTSIEDTSITKNAWNFTEVTGILPSAKEESFDYVRKTSDSKNLGFLDCPRMRIIIDTHKGNFAHSNSAVGKAEMLARDTNFSRDEFKENIQLSSFLQDAFLQTVQMADPKYLPRIMGGCGAAAPFGAPTNTYSYVKCFKHGTYERVYGTGTNELAYVIKELESQRPAEPLFCNRLRDKQEYLHCTYADKVFIPDRRTVSSAFWVVPPPIYKQAGTSIGISSVENRLVRAKKLTGAKNARLLVEQKDRIVQAIEGLKTVGELEFSRKVVSTTERKKFEGALQANSAFQRLMNRCGNDSDVNALLSSETHQTVGYGARYFERRHAIWLHQGGKGKVLNLRDIRNSEDMYLYSELSLENSLRVAGIPLNVLLNEKNIPSQTTVKKIGLYEISSTQEQWADKITQELTLLGSEMRPLGRVTVLNTFSRDPEWVNDDSMIISRVLREKTDKPNTALILLVSDDKKLAKQLARTANVHVARYSPKGIIETLGRDTWSSTSEIDAREIISRDPRLEKVYKSDNLVYPSVYIDTGSLMAAAVKYRQQTTVSGNKCLTLRNLTEVTRLPHRSATYIDVQMPNNARNLLQYELYSPATGKPRPSSYRGGSHALSDLLSNSTAETELLSINSRARSWSVYSDNA